MSVCILDMTDYYMFGIVQRPYFFVYKMELFHFYNDPKYLN